MSAYRQLIRSPAVITSARPYTAPFKNVSLCPRAASAASRRSIITPVAAANRRSFFTIRTSNWQSPTARQFDELQALIAQQSKQLKAQIAARGTKLDAQCDALEAKMDQHLHKFEQKVKTSLDSCKPYFVAIFILSAISGAGAICKLASMSHSKRDNLAH